MPRFQKSTTPKPPKPPGLREMYTTRWCIVCSAPFQPWRKDQIYCTTPDQIDCKMWLLEKQKEQLVRFIKALDAQDWTCTMCGIPGKGTPPAVAKRRTLSEAVHDLAPVSLAVLLLNPKRSWIESHEDYTDNHIVAVCHPCRMSYYVGVATCIDWTSPEYDAYVL